MKYMNKLIALLLITTLLGCEKYLDEPTPTESVSADAVFNTSSGVRAYFNGIYRNLKLRDEAARVAEDDASSASVLVTDEVRGIDVVNTPESGWFRRHYRYDGTSKDSDSRTSYFIWSYYYDIISNTNLLIEGVENSTLSELDKAEFIAEGKAIRAWCYFNLVREFAHNVPENKAIPVYTDVTSTENLEGGERSTVREVYDLIVQDLTDAVIDLPAGRNGSKTVVNLDVANGMLARVYSTIGIWDATAWSKAIIAAQAARGLYPLNANQYADEFDDISADEWIWGFDYTSEEHAYWGNLASWWDLNWSDGKDGYSNFNFTQEFVSLFAASDVRNLFAFNSARSFPDPSGNLMLGTTKFQFRSDFSEDYVMMRSSEMLLIEAEAEAEMGNDGIAASLLFQLQSNRDVNAVISGNTGQALMDEILVERRKELYGELGVSFNDAKRKRINLVRGDSHLPEYRFNIAPDDDRLILDVPQTEINANPNVLN